MPPIVSLILPTHNDLSYLETTLRSVSAQTFTNFELIIVDDGSTDSTPIRLRALVSSDARLRYVRREHGGIGEARNAGLAQAQGRYVAFVDADDQLHPALLHTLVSTAENSKADLVACALRPFADGNPCDFPPTKPEAGRAFGGEPALAALLAGDIAPTVCGRLYRRERLGALRFEPDMLFEDLDYTARALLLAREVRVLQQPLYGYRLRDGAMRRQFGPRLTDDRIRAARLLRETIVAAERWPQLQNGFRGWAARELGYGGFRDLLEAPAIDQDAYLRLLSALRTEGDLGVAVLRQLKTSREVRQWVGLPLLHPALGRWFLAFRFWQKHRR